MRLEGTQGIDAQGGWPFSISPDGDWLSFALGVPVPEEIGDDLAALSRYELDRLAEFRLMDLRAGDIIQPSVSAEAETLVKKGGHPLLGAGCWTGGRLAIRTALNRHLLLDPADKPPVWLPAPGREKLQGCPFPDRRPPAAGDYGPLRFEVDEQGQIVLTHRRSGHRMALHEPTWLPGMSVQMEFIEVSPDGKRVAYGILDHLGSFVGNTTLYVLDTTNGREPRALAAPVHYVRWAPDGALYGYAKSAGSGSPDYTIYRWAPAK